MPRRCALPRSALICAPRAWSAARAAAPTAPTPPPAGRAHPHEPDRRRGRGIRSGSFAHIEQHRPEADRLDVLPALVADHEQPRVARLDAERRRRLRHRVIVFADRERTPAAGASPRRNGSSERPSSRCDCCADRPHRIEECRREIDRLDEFVADRAARVVGGRRRIVDDERHLHRGSWNKSLSPSQWSPR